MRTRIHMYLGSQGPKYFPCLCTHVNKEIRKIISFCYCPFTLALLLMVFLFQNPNLQSMYIRKKSHSDYLIDYRHFGYTKTSTFENSQQRVDQTIMIHYAVRWTKTLLLPFVCLGFFSQTHNHIIWHIAQHSLPQLNNILDICSRTPGICRNSFTKISLSSNMYSVTHTIPIYFFSI